ncbi:MAG: SOS response-associated peptidase [Pseudomonadota bacterium]|nr:SOS response-associated peptidase [Pseudomonadota bacterium]
MCGRFVRYSSPEIFAELFGARGMLNLARSYNVAPSQPVLVARNGEGGGRELALHHWGLIPSWSKEPKTPYSTINARAETVDTKPAFRHAIRHRRCLIGSDGYYEWKKLERTPYFIRLKDAAPFAFAGLWEPWERGDERIDSCSIIVTDAAEALRDIHDRMPVILSPEHYDTWMDPELADPVQLKPLLAPYPSERMEAYPVSTRVNSPKNNHADLIVRMSLPPTGDIITP